MTFNSTLRKVVQYIISYHVVAELIFLLIVVGTYTTMQYAVDIIMIFFIS